MKQILVIVLLVLLAGCSNGKQGSNTSGINRIRATALAAQQREAEQAPAEIVVQPTSPPIAEARVDSDSGNLAFALGIVVIVFLTGFVAGAIVTAFALGQMEVKRGQANAR